MGVGEEALGAHLASEGWSLKPGVLAHFGQLEDLASARRALLDADLCRVGAPIALAGDARLAGPVVLQVVAVTDVSRPSRETRDPAGTAEWPSGKGWTSGADGDARRLSSASSPPRMLRVELTDGDRALVGVEHETMHAVADEASIPPGSKVLVPPNAVLQNVAGILLLRGDESLVPLGGRVAALVRDWERARARRGRAAAAKDTARDAPAYRPYDPRDAAATEAAAGKRRAEAKRAADEAAAGAAAAAAPPPPPPRRTTARRPTPRRGSFRAGDRRFPRRARNAPPRRHRARCFRSRGSRFPRPLRRRRSEKRLTPKKRNPASRRARVRRFLRGGARRLRRRSRRPQPPTRTRDVANACCLDSWSRPGRARRAVGREERDAAAEGEAEGGEATNEADADAVAATTTTTTTTAS